jgi:hypothetical protein
MLAVRKKTFVLLVLLVVNLFFAPASIANCGIAILLPLSGRSSYPPVL